jgi:hypothetical protein
MVDKYLRVYLMNYKNLSGAIVYSSIPKKPDVFNIDYIPSNLDDI